MIIYIDSDFKCHTTNINSLYTEITTNFFDDKCDTFIEGYRFIPSGESWIREDGEVFNGEMISPWKPYAELNSAQQEYEKQQLIEYRESLQELGVEL